MSGAKRYPAIMSPFASVLAHPSLAVHVRHIDVRSVPTVKNLPHPNFMNDCSRTIATCKNLSSFTCTPNVLSSFLLALQGKDNLQNLRVNASLTTEQSEQLVKVTGLRNLTLDGSTWNVVDVLPVWSSLLGSTLTSLTFYAMNELNDCVLETVLGNLPNLTGLHVVGCAKIDHTSIFRSTAHTPLLESLSFTSWESPRALPLTIGPLTKLRHLTVDTHCALAPSTTPTLWNSVITLTRTWSCPLTSITLKLSDKLVVGDSFIKDLLNAHEATLTHVAFLNCQLSLDAVRMICARCSEMERFAVGIPAKEIWSFSDCLSRSKSLHTLSDLGDHHSSHGQRLFLTRVNVQTIMERVPNLERVVTNGRVWTAEKRSRWLHDGLRISLERKKSPSPSHWFMPP
ncbi:hypothetical protein SCP_1701280 [Sparassis crispa]|uniref:RNI-like protein n=1 Tax=Sparassis crispa TaxID=139825 RepID=A0A401H5Y3_9APHY|nr:hypothetical protein SCP_1701280 [Sparassis crispa]GBE89803.1 hypothetical protein SCP_1701280 [Sparassis crispa]